MNKNLINAEKVHPSRNILENTIQERLEHSLNKTFKVNQSIVNLKLMKVKQKNK